jgi:hypothetical protein
VPEDLQVSTNGFSQHVVSSYSSIPEVDQLIPSFRDSCSTFPLRAGERHLPPQDSSVSQGWTWNPTDFTGAYPPAVGGATLVSSSVICSRQTEHSSAGCPSSLTSSSIHSSEVTKRPPVGDVYQASRLSPVSGPADKSSSPDRPETSSSASDSPPSPSPLWPNTSRSPTRGSEGSPSSGSYPLHQRSQSPAGRRPGWSRSGSPSSRGDSDSEESDGDYIRLTLFNRTLMPQISLHPQRLSNK